MYRGAKYNSFNDLKNELKQNPELIKNVTVENEQKQVILVDKAWHSKLEKWIFENSPEKPGKPSNMFFQRIKSNKNMKLHDDYEIIDFRIWKKISYNLEISQMDTVQAYLIKSPKDNSPMILIEPLFFKLFLPKNALYEKQYLNLAADSSWTISDLKKQASLYVKDKSNIRNSTLYKKYSSIELKDNMNLADLKRRYPNGEFELKVSPIATRPLHKRQESVKNPTPSRQRITGQFLSSDNNAKYTRNQSLQNSPRQCFGNNKYGSDSQRKIPSTNNSRFDVSNNYNNSSSKSTYNKLDSKNTSSNKLSLSNNSSNSHSSSSNLSNRSNMNSTSNKIDYDIRKTDNFPRPVGLHNLGNTCFFNAALQCLLRVQPLTDKILSPDFERNLNPNNPKSSHGRIARAYKKFLQEMCQAGSRSCDPSDLRNAIVSKFRRFDNYSQQDSQELLCALLDGIHEDLNQSAYAKGNQRIVNDSADMDSLQMHRQRNFSCIVDLFHGSLFSKVSCPECHHVEIVYDPFTFLSLDIPRQFHNVDLKDCLKKFSQKETLNASNKWFCENCRQKVCAVKKMGVYECPPILLIHLKRFSGDGYYTKIETPVNYPDTLDSSTFSKKDSGIYKLIGAVFHSGSLGGGHYTAAAIDPASNRWYNFNDSIASSIDRSGAHSGKAYILFYQRECL